MFHFPQAIFHNKDHSVCYASFYEIHEHINISQTSCSCKKVASWPQSHCFTSPDGRINVCRETQQVTTRACDVIKTSTVDVSLLSLSQRRFTLQGVSTLLEATFFLTLHLLNTPYFDFLSSCLQFGAVQKYPTIAVCRIIFKL